MRVINTLHKIQYQVAKLETIEFLVRAGMEKNPNSEIEKVCEFTSSLKKQLFHATEACLNSSLRIYKNLCLV